MSRKTTPPPKSEASEPHITKSFNLPLRLLDKVEAASEQEGRSRSKWLSRLLEAHFAKPKK